MATDAELLDRLKQHDPHALADVYDRYFDQIFRYLRYRISDPEVAADLTADVFLALVNALKDDRPPKTSLTGWLYAVGRNLAADYLRDKYKTVPLEDQILSTDSSLTDHAYMAHMAPILREAILQLTEEQQHVIALRFGQELSLAETAEIMEKSVGAIKALQHRALASLARHMPEQEEEINRDGQ